MAQFRLGLLRHQQLRERRSTKKRTRFVSVVDDERLHMPLCICRATSVVSTNDQLMWGASEIYAASVIAGTHQRHSPRTVTQ
jgi:hypothetical protein